MHDDKIWLTALNGLKGHPRELLAALCIFAGCGLLAVGVDPYVAIGFPGTIFCLNGFLMFLQHNHQRKLAEIEVRQIENLQGAALRDQAKKALERRRKSNAPKP